MGTIRAVILVIVLLPTTVLADGMDCKFVLGHADPNPGWVMFSGNAKLTINNEHLTALLYDSRFNGQHTESFDGILKSDTLVNGSLNSPRYDSETQLNGNYIRFKYPNDNGNIVMESLVVQNATTFLAITCSENLESNHSAR